MSLEAGQLVVFRVGQIGIPLEFHSYSGLAHSACPEEMRDLKKFIEGITAKPVEVCAPPERRLAEGARAHTLRPVGSGGLCAN
jgi:hypothetical protein